MRGEAGAARRGVQEEGRQGGKVASGLREPGDPGASTATSGEQWGGGGRSRERGSHHAQSLSGEEEEPGSLGPQLG